MLGLATMYSATPQTLQSKAELTQKDFVVLYPDYNNRLDRLDPIQTTIGWVRQV